MTDGLDIREGWDPNAAWWIMQNMRPRDAVEVFALRPTNDPADLFCEFQIMREQLAMVATLRVRIDGLFVPAALFAVRSMQIGVGQGVMFATPDIRARDLLVLAHWVRATAPRALTRAGLHRVQALSLDGYDEARHFMTACGLRYEGREDRVGKCRETFHRWIALAEDFEAELEGEN